MLKKVRFDVHEIKEDTFVEYDVFYTEGDAKAARTGFFSLTPVADLR